ncbi:MAG: 23S rRNA (adenine(2503)-C(2))-methyltransferase RlmN [Deltaproteobacteria bacterium]|nr:23S rRNA (adenine(2503)-C(2))-methyltransferase RlmN [Deltaproteobacteria bacterium]
MTAAFDILSASCEELESWFVSRGEKPFRGRQVFRWLHRRCAMSFDEMTDLTKGLRARLPEMAALCGARIDGRQRSVDGTIKYRFRLHDGQSIEGVFIPEQRRSTLCISTQVGCAMGCAFCATASMGLKRSLSAGEITGQLEAAVRDLRGETGSARPVSNVVFMGMGEPLANLDAVVQAVRILIDPRGMDIGRRHVTVSTAGLPAAMEDFVHRVPVRLAVSLNASTDEQRSRLMPVNRRHPIAELLRTCRNLPLQHNDRITFEYVLLGGVNDGLDDAERLAGLLEGLPAKVNLIPFNPCPGIPFEPPPPGRAEAFADRLAALHVTAMVRKSRGADLQAACGQLAARGPL